MNFQNITDEHKITIVQVINLDFETMVKISTKTFAATPANQDVDDQDDAQMPLKAEIFLTKSQLYTDFTWTFAATLQKFCG